MSVVIMFDIWNTEKCPSMDIATYYKMYDSVMVVCGIVTSC